MNVKHEQRQSAPGGRAHGSGWRAALFLQPTLAVFSTDAFAYLDPGTGSILLQGLIAAIAAAGTFAAMFWHRVKAFFRTLFGRSSPSERNEDEPPG